MHVSATWVGPCANNWRNLSVLKYQQVEWDHSCTNSASNWSKGGCVREWSVVISLHVRRSVPAPGLRLQLQGLVRAGRVGGWALLLKGSSIGCAFPPNITMIREGNRIRLLVLFVWALSVAGCADQCGQAYARILAHLCVCALLVGPADGELQLCLCCYHFHLAPPPHPHFPSRRERKTYSARHGSHTCSQLACKVNYS